MPADYVAEARTLIHAPVERVWEALTNPEIIKQYLFGTDVSTDWKVGSPIRYRGEWQGRAYEDKGTIVDVVPNQRLVSTFWSALSGVPDEPKYYQTVEYLLSQKDGGTEVTIRQNHNVSEEEKDHSEKNWSMVLDGMKTLLEK